jgi:TRAP transporter TAXI family solute receptor
VKQMAYCLLVIAAAASFLLGASGPTTKPPQTVTLDALASEMGTDIYRTFFGVADILQRTGSWVRMSPVESPGTQYNVEYLAKIDPAKKSRTIINTSDTGYWLAREGKPPHTKKHTNLRVIGGFNVTAVNWVTLDPNMKKLPDDIIGKRMGIFPARFAQAPYWDILINQVWRIRDKAKFTQINFNPAADALRDGTLDAVLMGTRMGKGNSWDLHTTLQEVLVKHKVYPLSLPEDDVQKVAKIAGLPIRTQTLPAGTYGPHQTQPVKGMRIVTIVMTCDASMEEGVVYELVKTMVENRQRFSEYVTYGDHVTPQLLVDLAPIKDISEFHPGALKYYREVGAVK